MESGHTVDPEGRTGSGQVPTAGMKFHDGSWLSLCGREGMWLGPDSHQIQPEREENIQKQKDNWQEKGHIHVSIQLVSFVDLSEIANVSFLKILRAVVRIRKDAEKR